MIAERILNEIDPSSRESWVKASFEVGVALSIAPSSEIVKLLEGLKVLANSAENEGDVGTSQALISVLTGYVNT